MNVFRISKTKYLTDDLNGIGAGLYGGRWNNIRIPCVYTSESQSLCILEHLSNISKKIYLHEKFTITTIFIPDNCISTPAPKHLPKNWYLIPAAKESKDFGSQLLISKINLAYRLPSAIVQNEFNIIIDPEHKDIRKISIIEQKPFIIDKRIMTNILRIPPI
jgi:RES domain-containing protein